MQTYRRSADTSKAGKGATDDQATAAVRAQQRRAGRDRHDTTEQPMANRRQPFARNDGAQTGTP